MLPDFIKRKNPVVDPEAGNVPIEGCQIRRAPSSEIKRGVTEFRTTTSDGGTRVRRIGYRCGE